MALTARIAALAQAVGADIKALTSGLAGKLDVTARAADSEMLDGRQASAFATADQGGKADSALQPGDYGIGDEAAVANDWDAVSATGFYRNTLTSAPGIPASAGNMTLLHVQGLGVRARQTAWSTSGNAQSWTRQRDPGGSWGEWVEFYHDGNFDPSSKVDKEPGKVLSSNDYTNSDKSKLAAMPRIEIVSELPAQEDPDTLYLVFPDESS